MFLLLPAMCVDLYFLFVCVVFYGQKVDIGTLSIIGLPERAKHNLSMSKKKTKWRTDLPEGLHIPLPLQ